MREHEGAETSALVRAALVRAAISSENASKRQNAKQMLLLRKKTQEQGLKKKNGIS